MRRYDLRHYKDDFYTRLGEIVESELENDEVAIFLFEIGDFSHVQRSADFIKQKQCIVLNSLRFNEVDWTISIKKVANIPQDTQQTKEENL